MPVRAILLLMVLLLSGCSFHLRGHGADQGGFAFHSIYINAPAETVLITNLRKQLAAYKLQVVQVPGQADLTLDIAFEGTDKQILALSGGGHVLEYLLYYRVSLRAYDRQQQEWLPADEIKMQRYFPYDDTQILAKEQEEVMLYQDMRSDAVQQIVRRLSLARPPQAKP